jgi:hypothetical protein
MHVSLLSSEFSCSLLLFPWAGYTINIYNTTSRHLINGNDANHFIAKDILSIHKIVLKGLHEQGVKGLSIEELNRQLGNQLQNLLDNARDLFVATTSKEDMIIIESSLFIC